MEYTLQDTHDELKELEAERRRELDQLADSIANNRISSLNPSAISDEVRPMKLKFAGHFLENLAKKEPSEFPVPGTADLRAEVLKQLKKETKEMEELQKSLQDELADIQEDIHYLKKKRDGLEKMKEADLEAANITLNQSLLGEQTILKRVFQETKKDLRSVVNVLFPDNDEMTDLLADLCGASAKGGDDVYVNVVPATKNCIAFLLENDIVQFHRNDTSKVKLTEML